MMSANPDAEPARQVLVLVRVASAAITGHGHQRRRNRDGAVVTVQS
jgi:hypothetical protein